MDRSTTSRKLTSGESSIILFGGLFFLVMIGIAILKGLDVAGFVQFTGDTHGKSL